MPDERPFGSTRDDKHDAPKPGRGSSITPPEDRMKDEPKEEAAPDTFDELETSAPDSSSEPEKPEAEEAAESPASEDEKPTELPELKADDGEDEKLTTPEEPESEPAEPVSEPAEKPAAIMPEEAPEPVSSPAHITPQPQDVMSGFGKPRRRMAKRVLMWLLVLIIGAAAGGAGVYAYYRKDIAKKPSVVTVTKYKTVPAKSGTTQPTTTPRQMEFTDLGVKYPLQENFDDFMLAEISMGKSTAIGITSRKLVAAQSKAYPDDPAAANACSFAAAPLGWLTLVQKADIQKTGPYSQTSLDADVKKGAAVKSGDNYVLYSTSQSTCSKNKDVQQIATDAVQSQSLKDLLKSFTAL